MEALRKRHIRSGREFDSLFPKSIQKDKVIRGQGKAKLHHTINLIKQIVKETKGDTQSLAQQLKAQDVPKTCQNIWDFVYRHIQYKRDKAGIEQVRRPSRTWADRKKGVDCDCYSVFISSILTNLDIPHKLRITKYGGKPCFQHIYPIVPYEGTYMVLDCVTDHFDHEVPFSEVRDFDMDDPSPVGEIAEVSGISGVDTLDLLGIEIGRTGRGRMPLRRTQTKPRLSQTLTPLKIQPDKPTEPTQVKKSSMVARKPVAQRLNVEKGKDQRSIITSTKKIKVGIAGKVLLAVGVGFGTFKIIEMLAASENMENKQPTYVEAAN